MPMCQTRLKSSHEVRETILEHVQIKQQECGRLTFKGNVSLFIYQGMRYRIIRKVKRIKTAAH